MTDSVCEARTQPPAPPPRRAQPGRASPLPWTVPWSVNRQLQALDVCATGTNELRPQVPALPLPLQARSHHHQASYTLLQRHVQSSRIKTALSFEPEEKGAVDLNLKISYPTEPQALQCRPPVCHKYSYHG